MHFNGAGDFVRVDQRAPRELVKRRKSGSPALSFAQVCELPACRVTVKKATMRKRNRGTYSLTKWEAILSLRHRIPSDWKISARSLIADPGVVGRRPWL